MPRLTNSNYFHEFLSTIWAYIAESQCPSSIKISHTGACWRTFRDIHTIFQWWFPNLSLDSTRGVYSTGIWVGGFGWLNKTLTLFKPQKMEILLPCLRESAVISYPVQDWTKQAVFKTLRMVHKFALSRIPMKAHEISENYVIEGGEKEKINGDDPV